MSIYNETKISEKENNYSLDLLDHVEYDEYLFPTWKIIKYNSVNGNIFKGKTEKLKVFENMNGYLDRLRPKKDRVELVEFDFEDDENDYETLHVLLEPIQKLAHNLISSTGLIISNTGSIFINGYRVNEKYEYTSSCMKHYSSNDAERSDVSTCIFFIKKSKDIEGGNFSYINSNKEKKIIEIEENDVVVLSGCIKHKPHLDISGIGSRNAIVVNFRSLV